MDKFIDDIINEEDISFNVETVNIMAGGSYINHVNEINEKINKDTQRNSIAYRKASFCAIG